eukprot:scaffold5108_cov172-Amphora_coffeaeformis.AAC.7
MLQAASVQPNNYSLRVRRKSESRSFADEFQMSDEYDDDADGGDVKGRNKSRRELPAGAVATLKAWLLSPEHFTHPYPTPQDQAMLMEKTGIDKKQLKNWFTNARRRIWKPMLKKQIEQGKLTTAPGIPGTVPGLMLPNMTGAPGMNGSMDNPHSVQAMRAHYQQAVQQQQQSQEEAAAQQQQLQSQETYGNTTLYSSAPSTGQGFYGSTTDPNQASMQQSSSIGTLPLMSSSSQLTKTDSHAVLMELFARDQDLVRQATESARLKAEQNKQQSSGSQPTPSAQPSSQHPMRAPSQSALQSVPTLNSWPHFSSINSLNNLGTMPGVKSITSLSGADLASKGNVGKMGNLAQVKSMESMGKTDSYAFLEVFFGDRSSNNLSGMEGNNSKGMKMPGGAEEDNEIGLCLDDESPAQPSSARKEFNSSTSAPTSQSAPQTSSSQEFSSDSGTLKRAYDDALAARGLMAVSRSSEKLTDLVLPDKLQRTLSQEFINKHRKQVQDRGQIGTPSSHPPADSTSQYPGQQPIEPSTTSEDDGQVKVPSTTTCALCHQTSVDTQLRPCGHMFHERCLKPSLQTPLGPPVCPMDNIPMQSALLAIPTDEPPTTSQQQQGLGSNSTAEFQNATA